jgi:hypothetical protein
MLPLFIASEKVKQRALGIFAAVVFGPAQRAELALVFSSLMSVFCGSEHGPGGYVAMALALLDALARAGAVGAEELELLASVVDPIMAVGDPACAAAVAAFIRFLKGVAQAGEEAVAAAALALMARWATPKQALVKKPM